MRPQQRLALCKSSFNDARKELPEEAGVLCLRTDVGEINVSTLSKTYKADRLTVLLRHYDVLALQPRDPILTRAASWNPRRSLLLGVSAFAVPHGVEHDVGKHIAVGNRCPTKMTSRMHVTHLIWRVL